MKVITEATLRSQLLHHIPEVYAVPPGTMLTPGAKAYLASRGIPIGEKKPEHMTHLQGHTLVEKSHPRIVFRGKLDSLQGEIVLAQTWFFQDKKSTILQELEEILHILREIMRCDVLELPMKEPKILGLNQEELHRQSHDPMTYFGVAPMTLPSYTMGHGYALLNHLRTAVREAEVSAILALGDSRPDLTQTLNRLSSAFHVMQCKYLANQYQEG